MSSPTGLLYAAVGVGLVAGFWALSHHRVRVAMLPLLMIGLAVSSAANLLTGLAGAVTVAFALQAVRGVGIAAVDVAVTTVVQRTVPPPMLGRAFGHLNEAVGLAPACPTYSAAASRRCPHSEHGPTQVDHGG